MRKKTMAWLAIAVAGWLSAPGFAAAEDQTYYGFGDGSNTGNISGVNWRLDKDYSHYGGHLPMPGTMIRIPAPTEVGVIYW